MYKTQYHELTNPQTQPKKSSNQENHSSCKKIGELSNKLKDLTTRNSDRLNSCRMSQSNVKNKVYSAFLEKSAEDKEKKSLSPFYATEDKQKEARKTYLKRRNMLGKSFDLTRAKAKSGLHRFCRNNHLTNRANTKDLINYDLKLAVKINIDDIKRK